MAAASGYAAVKAALVTRFRARAGLAGVEVSYEKPERADDVRGEFGAWEAIYFDNAAGTTDIRVLCGAANLTFDHDYLQTAVVQVLIPDSLGTQQAADERAEELLYEVQAELADQGEWDAVDLDLDDFEYIEVTPQAHRWSATFLPKGQGHGARCELDLRVQTRRSFFD